MGLDQSTEYRFERLGEQHRKPVIDIFNYYIENTFAAYPESRVGYDFFDRFLQLTEGYPAIAIRADSTEEIIGFALLRAHNPLPVFSRTAEISCFIKAGYTGKGIGGEAVDCLMKEANRLGIDSILANISSLNEGSIRFHGKNGFRECGRLERVGKKFGRDFDIVWMQRTLDFP